MKRRAILIAACSFAAVSLGLNVWLLVLRNQKSNEAPPPPAAAAPLPTDVGIGPVLQPVTMDFSGTAFADGSWKLTDDPDPAVRLDEKPFSWDDLPPPGRQKAALRPPATKTNVPGDDPLETVPYDLVIPFPADSWRPPWKGHSMPFDWREVPGYLGQPLPNPNDVSRKTLLATPPPR